MVDGVRGLHGPGAVLIVTEESRRGIENVTTPCLTLTETTVQEIILNGECVTGKTATVRRFPITFNIPIGLKKLQNL